MPKLLKGQITPLNVTKEAQHRIFAGLGWDPKADTKMVERVVEAVGGKKTYHDLDLSAYIYGADKEFHGLVAAKSEDIAFFTPHIYHSGDNIDGTGDGDDEQVSVELKDLDERVTDIIFTVTIPTGHHFDEITAPEIRLVDGYTGHVFISTPLDESKSKYKSSYIFCRLFRGKGDSWNLHFIDEFVYQENEENWVVTIQEYLDNKDVFLASGQ